MAHVHNTRAPRKVSAHSLSPESADKARRCLDMARLAIGQYHPRVADILLTAARRTTMTGVRNLEQRSLLLAEIDELALLALTTESTPPLSAIAWATRALNVADRAVERGDFKNACTALRSGFAFLRCVPTSRQRSAWLREGMRILAWKAELELAARAA